MALLSACLVCDGKWEAHETLYEDEESRRELGKAVGPKFYPLADNPEIQEVFLQQLEEEAAAAAAEAAPGPSTTHRFVCYYFCVNIKNLRLLAGNMRFLEIFP